MCLKSSQGSLEEKILSDIVPNFCEISKRLVRFFRVCILVRETPQEYDTELLKLIVIVHPWIVIGYHRYTCRMSAPPHFEWFAKRQSELRY